MARRKPANDHLPVFSLGKLLSVPPNLHLLCLLYVGAPSRTLAASSDTAFEEVCPPIRERDTCLEQQPDACAQGAVPSLSSNVRPAAQETAILGVSVSPQVIETPRTDDDLGKVVGSPTEGIKSVLVSETTRLDSTPELPIFDAPPNPTLWSNLSSGRSIVGSSACEECNTDGDSEILQSSSTSESTLHGYILPTPIWVPPPSSAELHVKRDEPLASTFAPLPTPAIEVMFVSTDSAEVTGKEIRSQSEREQFESSADPEAKADIIETSVASQAPSALPTLKTSSAASATSTSTEIARSTANTGPGEQATSFEESASSTTIPSATPDVPPPTSIIRKPTSGRFNFASFDCGALILAQNPEASSATSILHKNKDAYMLNKCTADRFVTVELCEDILVDTVMLANFEFFSSMFKDFRLDVSDRYPPKNNEWTALGVFRAKDVRDFQYFTVENPRIWARYLRITFLSEYGHEYYCPLSMLRVYGTTMMEEVKAEEDKKASSAAESETAIVAESAATLEVPKPPLLTPPRIAAAVAAALEDQQTTMNSLLRFPTLAQSEQRSRAHSPALQPPRVFDWGRSTSIPPKPSGAPMELPLSATPFNEAAGRAAVESSNADLKIIVPERFYAIMGSREQGEAANDASGWAKRSSATNTAMEAVTKSTPSEASVTRSVEDRLSSLTEPKDSAPTTSQSLPAIPNGNANMYSGASAQGSINNGGHSGIPSPGGSAGGGTQESIFKTIMKRLAVLERNATLSYAFLEEQSKALNEIFGHSAVRERERFDSLFTHFNRTLYGIFNELHAEYTTSWSHMFSEIESQKRDAGDKIAEVDRLITVLEKQIPRQIGVQALITVIAFALGWILSNLFAMISFRKRKPAVKQQPPPPSRQVSTASLIPNEPTKPREDTAGKITSTTAPGTHPEKLAVRIHPEVAMIPPLRTETPPPVVPCGQIEKRQAGEAEDAELNTSVLDVTPCPSPTRMDDEPTSPVSRSNSAKKKRKRRRSSHAPGSTIDNSLSATAAAAATTQRMQAANALSSRSENNLVIAQQRDRVRDSDRRESMSLSPALLRGLRASSNSYRYLPQDDSAG
ncbi:UNC-like C-terminal-domain-containing protein [Fimicolochytrium jonesii]|uniref:UNC-like C-terminal-domain-containing protein n=1 Tax=Fimicolochytrium jonesii TaxID=1396493 RepID=UPI0022FE1564|nr:UNC-like C-terminal-domain-containing protein [Fimicolochytrium jonesii]KAI8825645.1 UNC-like C-terminal-domain-containing protein [Fimicolochytrium jonesii]